MRLLSAINYEGIEDYLRYLPEIEVFDSVKNKKALMDKAVTNCYDLVLISMELPGSEKMETLIELLLTEELKGHRIVFIYGEYDDTCDDFIRFLLGHGVYDFYVGEEITSREIERLIFRPAGKEAALEYFKSCYDKNRCLRHKELTQNQSRGFFNAASELTKANSYKRVPFEKAIIAIISNQATGKSHTAWNMSCCFSKRGYSTSLINIDRGYSSNLFFDIDEIYYDLLNFTLHNNKHKDILDSCFRRKNLSIITGKLGDDKELSCDDFLKLLYGIRTKSDITIIDTRTGLSALTRICVKSSTYDLMIFDCDIMHFHMNMKMIEELKDDFAPEKTVAVINNTNIKSSGHKYIYNELVKSGIPFKDIAFICSCGSLSYEVMHTGISPYQAAGEEFKDFVHDIDHLMDKLCGRTLREGFAWSILGRLGGRGIGLY